jgi:hypothetical protein
MTNKDRPSYTHNTFVRSADIIGFGCLVKDDADTNVGAPCISARNLRRLPTSEKLEMRPLNLHL